MLATVRACTASASAAICHTTEVTSLSILRPTQDSSRGGLLLHCGEVAGLRRHVDHDIRLRCRHRVGERRQVADVADAGPLGREIDRLEQVRPRLRRQGEAGDTGAEPGEQEPLLLSDLQQEALPGPPPPYRPDSKDQPGLRHFIYLGAPARTRQA